MSGYLFYPINHTNLVAFDWTIPKEVLLLDDFFARYGSRGIHEQAVLAPMNLRQLTGVWLKQSFQYPYYFFGVAAAGFFLPPIAIFYMSKKKQLPKQIGLLLGIYYLAAIIWMLYSPEYRFGITLLELLILFSLLQIVYFFPISFQWLWLAQAGMSLFLVAHFALDFVQRPSNRHLRFSKHWFFPAKDYRLLVSDSNQNSFPYVMLQPGIPLYFSDSSHHCMNACLPCMSWRYGDIEMRGTSIQQGFRNVRNEVRKNYPWLPH
ncbi:MAG: hypothetical protein EOO61_22330 [Hymenobacter sp.]|nr:MAG: hypothetical protein EOO61_22330 [Hymenobacter sp.]